MGKIPRHKSPDDCCDMNADFYIGARVVVSGTFHEIYFTTGVPYTLAQDEHHYEFNWPNMGLSGYIRKNTELGREITKILDACHSSFTGKHTIDDTQQIIDMVMPVALPLIDPETLLERLKASWERGRLYGDHEAKVAMRKALGITIHT